MKLGTEYLVYGGGVQYRHQKHKGHTALLNGHIEFDILPNFHKLILAQIAAGLSMIDVLWSDKRKNHH